MKQLRSDLTANPPLAGSFTPKKGSSCVAQFSDGLWCVYVYVCEIFLFISRSTELYPSVSYFSLSSFPLPSSSFLPSFPPSSLLPSPPSLLSLLLSTSPFLSPPFFSLPTSPSPLSSSPSFLFPPSSLSSSSLSSSFLSYLLLFLFSSQVQSYSGEDCERSSTCPLHRLWQCTSSKHIILIT